MNMSGSADVSSPSSASKRRRMGDEDDPVPFLLDPQQLASPFKEMEDFYSQGREEEFIENYEEAEKEMAVIKGSMPVTGWDIGNADLTPQPNELRPTHSNRICDNCFKRGHNAPDCQSPKMCRTCDTLGHSWRECKICLKCGMNKQSSNAKSCQDCLLRQNSTCEMCKGKHDTQQCDQLWRRFHSVTKEDTAAGNLQEELKQNLHIALEKDKSNYGKEQFIWYPVTMFPSNQSLDAAASQVRSTFANVAIKWSKNNYGDQMTVTLKGKGNTEKAKSLFKSIIDGSNA